MRTILHYSLNKNHFQKIEDCKKDNKLLGDMDILVVQTGDNASEYYFRAGALCEADSNIQKAVEFYKKEVSCGTNSDQTGWAEDRLIDIYVLGKKKELFQPNPSAIIQFFEECERWYCLGMMHESGKEIWEYSFDEDNNPRNFEGYTKSHHVL